MRERPEAVLADLWLQVRSYDDNLNARETAPTGDDYNAMLAMVTAAMVRAGEPFRGASGKVHTWTPPAQEPQDYKANMERLDRCYSKLFPEQAAIERRIKYNGHT